MYRLKWTWPPGQIGWMSIELVFGKRLVLIKS